MVVCVRCTRTGTVGTMNGDLPCWGARMDRHHLAAPPGKGVEYQTRSERGWHWRWLIAHVGGLSWW